MSSAIKVVQTEAAFGQTLQMGVRAYGASMMSLCLWYLLDDTLAIQDWLFLVIVCVPAATLFGLQVWKPDEFAYVWANWYANFAGFCYSSVLILFQTYRIYQLITLAGVEGAIRFRMTSQAATPFA